MGKKCPKCGADFYPYSKQCLHCYQKEVSNPLPRLLRHVKKTKTCWIWVGCLSKHGYGKTNIRLRKLPAHRAFYELFKGPIPPGKCVCHTCDNPPCVNPDHLWVGTNKENLVDMIKKKRQIYGHTKVSFGTIKAIRKSKNITYVDLGKKYGISNVQAKNIKLGISWPIAKGELMPLGLPSKNCHG